jgi:hypothetical protein
MKITAMVLAFLLTGCVSVFSYAKDDSYTAWVIYTGFDSISSHMRGPFDFNYLKTLYPKEKLLSQADTSSLVAALEKARIGKSTAAERRQMRGPTYLAIFRAKQQRRPVYVSNGCHVLNLETGDLYRLEADTAISVIGIPADNYAARLCKEPGFGIVLSPR